jgi:recombinational DNA repair ATPase RecF
MLERFELLNFRNYRHLDIEFLPRGNLVTGRNAQGRSNLLGSIYFLSYLRSKRAARLADLVREGTEKASVLGIIMVNWYETKVKLTFGQGEQPGYNHRNRCPGRHKEDERQDSRGGEGDDKCWLNPRESGISSPGERRSTPARKG